MLISSEWLERKIVKNM